MSNYSHNRTGSSVSLQNNTSCNRVLESKMNDIALIKRMVVLKIIELSEDDWGRLEFGEKMIKALKKEAKDKKISDTDTNFLFEGLFEDIEDIVKDCIWTFRAERTDYESLFLKLKLNDKTGKNFQHIEEVIQMHDRNPHELLLNQQKNIIQSFTIATLCQKSIQLLKNTAFGKELVNKFSSKPIANIVHNIAKGYNIVPYHNFSHGFGVFLSYYNLNFQINGLKGLLSDLQLFFSSIACLSHDIGHNGNNTLFEVKTDSHMAIKYGHFSVMEKMHLAKTMEILDRNPQANQIFLSLSSEDKQRARKVISLGILATDMAQHYILLDQIKEKVSDCEEDRDIVIQNLVHACDIQNPALEYESYLSWAQLVCIQFHDQTVKQQLWNVEVTEFLKFNSLPYFYKNQLSFASSIVLPLWNSLGTMFPEINERGYSQRIKKNISLLTEAMRRNSECFSKKPMEKYLIFQLAN